MQVTKRRRRFRIGRLIPAILLPIALAAAFLYGCDGLEEPIDENLPDYTAKVAEMRGVNEDAVGWLYLPGTGIDDVVLHEPRGQGNGYYLSRDINLNPAPEGSVCADYRAEFGKGRRRTLAPLTTLYGHSFSEDPNGKGPFSPLKYFRDEAFARAHPYLFFSTIHENMAFEIVAVFEAHIDLPYNRYDLPEAAYQRMLDAVLDSSLYRYDVEIARNDKLLVLSTCAMTVQGYDNLDPYNTAYRLGILAKLVPAGGPLKEEASLTANLSPAAPDTYLNFNYS